jgi:hypothetical protein
MSIAVGAASPSSPITWRTATVSVAGPRATNPGYLRIPLETWCPVLFGWKTQQFLSSPETTDTFAEMSLTHERESCRGLQPRKVSVVSGGAFRGRPKNESFRGVTLPETFRTPWRSWSPTAAPQTPRRRTSFRWDQQAFARSPVQLTSSVSQPFSAPHPSLHRSESSAASQTAAQLSKMQRRDSP